MNKRHEKIKPHLVKQYEAQDYRIHMLVVWALTIFKHDHNNRQWGSYFSTRFKNK